MTFLTNRGKNEDENEKIWENESYFIIFHIKIRSCVNFHENPGKKLLTLFLQIFLTNQSKSKNEDERIWKNEFEYWILISKLGYAAIFMKIWEKNF